MKFRLMRSRTAREISRAPIRVDIFSSIHSRSDSFAAAASAREVPRLPVTSLAT